MPETLEINPETAMSAFRTNITQAAKDNPAPPKVEPKADAPPAKAETPPVKAEVPAEPPQPEIKPTATQEPTKAAVAADDKQPRTSQQWEQYKAVHAAKEKELSGAIKKLEKERDELSKRISESTNDPEKEQLRSQVKELSEQVWAIGREHHPEFKKEFDNKISEMLEDIKQIGGESIAKLVSAPDYEGKRDKLKEAILELDELDRGDVNRLAREVDKLRGKRTAALSKSKEEYERMISEHQTKVKAEQLRRMQEGEKAVNAYYEHGLRTLDIAPIKERDGDEEWNAGVESRRIEAREVLGGKAAPEKVVETILRGVAYAEIEKALSVANEENAKLKKQLEGFTSASPKIQPGGHAETTTESRSITPDLKQGMRPQDAAMAWRRGLPSK